MDVLERVRLLPEGDYQAYSQPYSQTYNEAGVGRTVVDPLLCPVEVAARIVGQKWTLQIVKTLLDSQSRRFCELQDALGGVNPSTLSSRLKMLEDEGLIRRVQVRSPSGVRIGSVRQNGYTSGRRTRKTNRLTEDAENT